MSSEALARLRQAQFDAGEHTGETVVYAADIDALLVDRDEWISRYDKVSADLYDSVAALAVAREREQRAAKALERIAKMQDPPIFLGIWEAIGVARAALVDEPAAGPQADSGDARDAVVWSEPRQDYTGRFYRDGLGTGTGAEADALLNATLAEPDQAERREHQCLDAPVKGTPPGSASAAADEPGETPA